MLVTKKHKGINIRIINPEVIPKIEEKIKKWTIEMIMAEKNKEVES